MPATINYFDYDDEDFKDAIKNILRQKDATSQSKHDQLIKLIEEAPIDERTYENLLTIFRKSIFERKGLSILLQPEKYIKSIYMYLMSFHIGTLLAKNMHFAGKLKYYKDNANDYGLTIQEIDGYVWTNANGKTGTYLANKIALQNHTQVTELARMQAVASRGLPEMNDQNTRKEEKSLAKVVDKVDNTLKLGEEYRRKIIAGLKTWAENPSEFLNLDVRRLDSLQIDKNFVMELQSTIVKAIEQNSNMIEFAKGRLADRNLEKSINRISKVLNEIIKNQNKADGGMLEAFVNIGFTLVFSGLAVGAIGAIASRALKNTTRFDKFNITAPPPYNGLKIERVKFWDTNKGKIIDEAIRDSLKQGLRGIPKYKRYFEDNPNALIYNGDGSGNELKQNIISLMGIQMEQYCTLLIVLSHLGFLNNQELKISTDYFYNRLVHLGTTENKDTYISILEKEAIMAPLLEYSNKEIVMWTEDEVINSPDYLGNLQKDRRNSPVIEAMTMMDAGLHDYIYDYLNKEVFYSNSSPTEIFPLAKMVGSEKTEIERFLFSENDENAFSMSHWKMAIRIYKIENKDFAVFLESRIYDAPPLRFNALHTGRFFLGYVPHISRKESFTKSSPMFEVITPSTPFYNNAREEEAYPKHLKEKELLRLISNNKLA